MSDPEAWPTPQRSEGARPARRSSLTYQPGLDGIRALAVAAVVVYHGDFDFARGGFLGVSIFFTLSGFLITSLLVGEHARHGSISLREFWARRFRRLLPASWLTIGLVVLAGAFGLWTNSQARGLLADVPAALAQVANWRQIVAGQTYGAQFAAPSPLEHYWSLAIEEQFYVVFPVLVAGCGMLAKRFRWSLRVTVGVMASAIIVGSVIATLVVGPNGSRAYLGTDTRAAELAVGALLAVVWFSRDPIRQFWTRTTAEIAGVVALGFWVWTWHSVTLTDHWLFPWGLLLTAVSTSLVILAVVQRGWLAAAIGSPPLRALGRISYGVYLLHWPIGRLLTPARTGLGQWPLFFLQTATSIAAATLSFHFIEMPIRRGRRIGFRRTVLVGAALAAVLLIGNVVINNVAPVASATTRSKQTTIHTVPPTRVLLIGDQLAGSLGPAIAALPKDHFVSRVEAIPDCGLTEGGWVQLADGRVESDSDRCGQADSQWQSAEADFRPDVVVIWGGTRDVSNRRLGNDVDWASPPTPALDDFLEAGLRARIGGMAAHGAKVVVLTLPVAASTTVPAVLPPLPPAPSQDVTDMRKAVAYSLALAEEDAPVPTHAENDPVRVADFNQLLRTAASATGAKVIDAGGDVSIGHGTVTGTGVDPASATAVANLVATAVRGDKRHETPAKVAPPTESLPAPPPAAPRRTPGTIIRTSVVGDSVGIGIANGLGDWGPSHDMEVTDDAALGCPIARGGLYRMDQDVLSFPSRCSWGEPDGFPQMLSDTRPDVVVVEDGAWEVLDRLPTGSTTWEHIGQPDADRFILAEMLRAIDLLGSQGARVVLLTSAHVNHRSNEGFRVMPDSDPKRIDRFNQIVRQAAAMRPGVATAFEFGAWVATQPGGEFGPNIREDGVHYLAQFAPAIGQWIGTRIEQLVGR